jgi:hypothetical protein
MLRNEAMVEYHAMVNLPRLKPSLTARPPAIRVGRPVLLIAILAITLSSCSSDPPPENGAAGGGPADQFELTDRAGKTYLLTDLYTCAPTDKTGDQRCDYRQFYLLSGGVHYRFDWDGIQAIERQSQSPGDVFKLTLKGGQSLVGTFDQPPYDGKGPYDGAQGRPVGPANSLSASVVGMSGNTAVFPVSLIGSLHRRSAQK